MLRCGKNGCQCDLLKSVVSAQVGPLAMDWALSLPLKSVPEVRDHTVFGAGSFAASAGRSGTTKLGRGNHTTARAAFPRRVIRAAEKPAFELRLYPRRGPPPYSRKMVERPTIPQPGDK